MIPVTQGAPMSVSQREIYSNSRGENFTLSVVTTGDWSVTFNDSWIKVEKKDSKTVSVTTEPNESKTSRKGTLDIVSGAEKITVSVAQESAEDREINTPEGYRPKDIAWFGTMSLTKALLLASAGPTKCKSPVG